MSRAKSMGLRRSVVHLLESARYPGLQSISTGNRDKDDVVATSGAYAMNEREAIHPWHSDVQQHAVGPELLNRRQRAGPVVRSTCNWNPPSSTTCASERAVSSTSSTTRRWRHAQESCAKERSAHVAQRGRRFDSG